MNFNSQANNYEINYSMHRERNGDEHVDHRNDHNDGRNDHGMHGRYHEDQPQSFAAYSDKDMEAMHNPNLYHPSQISATLPPQIAPLNYHHPSSTHSPFSPHSIPQNSPHSNYQSHQIHPHFSSPLSQQHTPLSQPHTPLSQPPTPLSSQPRTPPPPPSPQFNPPSEHLNPEFHNPSPTFIKQDPSTPLDFQNNSPPSPPKIEPSTTPNSPIQNVNSYPEDHPATQIASLNSLQTWVNSCFSSLTTTILKDSENAGFLRITPSSCHKDLHTRSSVELICWITSELGITARLLSYNGHTMRRFSFVSEEAAKEGELKNVLKEINSQKTFVCLGISEDKFESLRIIDHLPIVLIERFQSKVVLRSRNCQYVSFESQCSEKCSDCEDALSKCQTPLVPQENDDQELEFTCAFENCGRKFRRKGTLVNHEQWHLKETVRNDRIKREISDDDEDFEDLKPEVIVKADPDEFNDDAEEPVIDYDYDPADFDFETENYFDDDEEPLSRRKGSGKRNKYRKQIPGKKRRTLANYPKQPCPDCEKVFLHYKSLLNHCWTIHYRSAEDCPKKVNKIGADGFEGEDKVKTEGVINDLLDEMDGVVKVKKEKRVKRIHGPDEKPPNKCPDCTKAFWDYPALVRHCWIKHQRPKESCPAKDMKQYMDKKQWVSSLPTKFVCELCAKSFRFESGLTNHTKRFHTETAMIPCDQCGKTVKQSNMDIHMKIEHAEKRYTCPDCGKSFYYESHLVYHQVSHTDPSMRGVSYVCDQCGKEYTNKVSLKRHVAIVHQNHKPHACDHCGKRFYSTQKLRKHVSGHFKAHIFICSLCNARFYYRDNHRFHVRKAHPDHEPNDAILIMDNPDKEHQELFPITGGQRMRLKKLDYTPTNLTLSRPIEKREIDAIPRSDLNLFNPTNLALHRPIQKTQIDTMSRSDLNREIDAMPRNDLNIFKKDTI